MRKISGRSIGFSMYIFSAIVAYAHTVNRSYKIFTDNVFQKVFGRFLQEKNWIPGNYPTIEEAYS